jgi:predicted TIM-barrel fold metal-dependent hydrolase
MTKRTPGTQEWLDQVTETIIDSDRVIVDPHHHLFEQPAKFGRYTLQDLWRDTGSGHRIEKTVFLECGSSYRSDGPEHLRCVGETELVTGIAAESARGGPGKAVISGIVGRADLGRGEAVQDVLDAHRAVAGDLFKGVRQSVARAEHPEALSIPVLSPAGLYASADFRRGAKRIGDLGYTFDAWHYYHQNADFAAFARAVPDTVMILDHFGTPLGVGVYAERREGIFAQWKRDITEIAACPNVFAKLGGMAMADNGFGWNEADIPADSRAFVEAQRRYYLHAIEAFGPARCMFESNFPVDRASLSYAVLWNALKRIAAEFNDAEQDAMFRGTATRVYRL